MPDVDLEMKGIIKNFPGVRALNNVNFEARSGELLAPMAENGTEKPTVMKVMSGVWPFPTYEGDIILRGKRVQVSKAEEAEEARIAIIFQDLNPIPDLTVSETIDLARLFANDKENIDWNQAFQNTQEIPTVPGQNDI